MEVQGPERSRVDDHRRLPQHQVLPADFETAAPAFGPLTIRVIFAALIMLVTAVTGGYTLSHGYLWPGVGFVALVLLSLVELLRIVNRKLRGELG